MIRSGDQEGKKMARRISTAEWFILVAVATYLWFVVSEIIFEAMSGEARALLSILLGWLTAEKLGLKFLKFRI